MGNAASHTLSSFTGGRIDEAALFRSFLMKTPIPLRKNEQWFIKDKINIVKKNFKAALKKVTTNN